MAYRFDAGIGAYRNYPDEDGSYSAPLPVYEDPSQAQGPVIGFLNENSGYSWQAVPTNSDWTGWTYSGQDKTILGDAYKNAAGDIRYYQPGSDEITGTVKAPPTTYDPNSLQTNYQGYKYYNDPGNETYNPATYYVDPATNKLKLYNAWDVNSPFNIAPPRQDGGFDTWMTENGWIAPLAIIGAGVASGALGAGAAGAEAGGLAGPTYGELGITGVEGGFAGPTYAEMGYTGLNQAEAIAAADAASKGLTGAEALKYVNQARQGLGLASTLSKLLGGGQGGKTGSAGGNLDLGNLAKLLGGGAPQTNDFIGQIKGNQNPFIFTPPGQTQATEGTYDVSGSNLANALRKK